MELFQYFQIFMQKNLKKKSRKEKACGILFLLG